MAPKHNKVNNSTGKSETRMLWKRIYIIVGCRREAVAVIAGIYIYFFFIRCQSCAHVAAAIARSPHSNVDGKEIYSQLPGDWVTTNE